MSATCLRRHPGVSTSSRTHMSSLASCWGRISEERRGCRVLRSLSFLCPLSVLARQKVLCILLWTLLLLCLSLSFSLSLRAADYACIKTLLLPRRICFPRLLLFCLASAPPDLCRHGQTCTCLGGASCLATRAVYAFCLWVCAPVVFGPVLRGRHNTRTNPERDRKKEKRSRHAAVGHTAVWRPAH